MGHKLNPPNNESDANNTPTDSENESTISPHVVLNSQLDNSYVQLGEFEEEISFDNIKRLLLGYLDMILTLNFALLSSF